MSNSEVMEKYVRVVGDAYEDSVMKGFKVEVS